MDFKYIKNIYEGVGEIRIYDPIGASYRNGKEVGISGSVFANEMAHLNEVCDSIHIRVNSEGGSILDGYAIFSSILNSKVKTTGFIDGVAASTAGWCALACNEVNISDYGSLMIHGASGSDDQDLISLANGSIAKMLSNRTGMTEDETKDLMTKETWYKAFDKKDRETLINKKLVDKIISTGKTVKLPKNKTGLAHIYNKLINPNMSKLNTLLKLKNDAEEQEQETAIVELNKQVAEQAAELTDFKNKLKVIADEQAAKEAAAKEALKTRDTELVNKAVTEGKLSQAESVSTIENASKDEASFSFVSNLISKLGNGKESKKPFDFSKVENSKGAEDRSGWSWTKWSKEDPSGLEKIANENPEAFKELYNKEFPKK